MSPEAKTPNAEPAGATGDYGYTDAESSCANAYLFPAVEKLVVARRPDRIFDLGCGNGAVSNLLSRHASIVGVDAAQSGVAIAKRQFPHMRIEYGSAYDDLAAEYGRFPMVISLEVVEHLYSPRAYAKTLFDLVEPGGEAVVSTPFHGYWKNLAIALSGRMDAHFSALWDGGHIKFWSIPTLRSLLEEAGFRDIRFLRVGRIPQLAKSMIAVAGKPLQ